MSITSSDGTQSLLSPRSETVVRATAAVVAEHAEQITARFYPRMFAEHPQLLRVFNQGNQATGEQSRALAASVVAYAVQLIDSAAPSFQHVMQRIAHKHVSLGIRPEQYTIVGHHLLGAVGEVLGDAVTPEVADAWSEVYWLFAAQLIAEEARLYQQAGVDPAHPLRPYRVVRRIEETADVISLVLEPADGGALPEIRPGSTCRCSSTSRTGIVSPASTPCPRRVRDPAADHRASGARRRTARRTVGCPRYLHDQVAVGDLVDVSAPAGDFVVRSSDGPLLLASAGAGITTVLPIVEHIARTQPARTVIVAHADRTARTTRCGTPCCTWDDRSTTSPPTPGTNPSTPADHRSQQGLMDLSEMSLPADVQVFTCGPLPFMRHVRSSLLARGVPASRIRYEVFGPDLWGVQG